MKYQAVKKATQGTCITYAYAQYMCIHIAVYFLSSKIESFTTEIEVVFCRDA